MTSLQTLLRKLFRDLEIDCVFDVGANTGGYGEFLRHIVRYDGLIVSFEPVKSVFNELQRCAARYPRWTVRNLALGSQAGNLTIHVTKDSSFSTFLVPRHDVVGQFQGQNEVEKDESVPVQSLDSVFAELQAQFGFKRPYLKMDTQGYDTEVIAGGGKVLGDFLALQSEIALLPVYKDMPDIMKMYPLIVQSGFDLAGMYPVNRDAQGRWIETDAVFLRRK